MRRVVPLILAAALCAATVGSAAAAAPPCPASWEAKTTLQAATDFFPHLLPGQFTSPAEFADVIAADVKDDDGQVCVKLMWGETLNPRSHWYRLGMEVLGEPVHQMLVKDAK